MFKSSNYNIIIASPDKGRTLIFNSLYGSMTMLETAETDNALAILANPGKPIMPDEEQMTEILVNQKHLVEESVDELGILRKRKEMGIKDRNRIDIIIMPTMDCNFACAYCYEKPERSEMSDTTAIAIKKWMEKELPAHVAVMLYWFGGEPLLQLERVLDITKHANEVCARSGCHLLAHITTNGYLFSEKNIGRIVSSGITDFQITVDGPQEYHDRLRVLRNGNGTFDRVFNNVVSLSRAGDDVRISLRVNFNHTNFEGIPELLRLFPEDIRPKLRVVFEPIFGGTSLSATDNISMEEIGRKIIVYYEMAEKMKYIVSAGSGSIAAGKLVYCYAERESQYIINYNGDVFKCAVCDFSTSDRAGYITESGEFIKLEEQWDKWVNKSLFAGPCLSCKFLPLCMGGCISERLRKGEDGDHCTLVPTNVSAILKQVAMGTFDAFVENSLNSIDSFCHGCKDKKNMIDSL